MHFFFDFFLKCVPIIAKMRYLCGGFPETMACPDGGMVDTRDLKSLGLYGCAGSSPAWGTKRRASSSLSSVSVFPLRSSHPVAHPSVRVYAPPWRYEASPAWGTKRRASSFLSSVFVFPSVPLTLLLTFRFASTHPSLSTVSRGFASAIHNSVIHILPLAPLLPTTHPILPPRLPSILPPFLLPFCCLLEPFLRQKLDPNSTPRQRSLSPERSTLCAHF